MSETGTRFGAKLCDTLGCLTNVKETQAYCQKCTINTLRQQLKEAQEKVKEGHIKYGFMDNKLRSEIIRLTSEKEQAEARERQAVSTRNTFADKLEQAEAEVKKAEGKNFVQRDLIKNLRADNAKLREDYQDLIMRVSCKLPNETRHETAKRYIREREERAEECCAKEVK